MTFKEILNQAEVEETTNRAKDTTEADVRKTELLAYFKEFFHFLQLANNYKLNKNDFITKKQSITDFKEKLETQIRNKGFCQFEVDLTKTLGLRVRFFNDINVGCFIRVQLKTENTNFSEDFTNQEEAAKHLAKIIVKYKD